MKKTVLSPEEKANQVRLAVAWIAGSMHVVQTLVFFAFGYPRLAIASSGAVLIFMLMTWLVKHGRARLGSWIGYLEIVTHISTMLCLWGTAAGYWVYYVIVAGGAFLTFSRAERWDRFIGTALPVVIGPALFLFVQSHGALVLASPSMITFLAILNVFGGLFGMTAITVWFSTVADIAEEAAHRERARSEKLLENILPAPIAARLKDGPVTIVDAFDGVTVLFADLVGFTTLSARIPTNDLIVLLNDVFSKFDALAEKYGLEKIKTIGDAYMVVGGVPTSRADHANAVARMAIDMRDAIANLPAEHGEKLGIRIGIHSGPVVAGVIGTRKFSYDLWGDTVNTASRMESHGEPGKIQVSEATHALLDGEFVLRERGSITVKGKGEMKTWFLEETKSPS